MTTKLDLETLENRDCPAIVRLQQQPPPSDPPHHAHVNVAVLSNGSVHVLPAPSPKIMVERTNP
jgi:hypothetical protein